MQLCFHKNVVYCILINHYKTAQTWNYTYAPHDTLTISNSTKTIQSIYRCSTSRTLKMSKPLRPSYTITLPLDVRVIVLMRMLQLRNSIQCTVES